MSPGRWRLIWRIRESACSRPTTAACRRRATGRSRRPAAPYIALLDGDDLFRPDYLAHAVAALDADPAARLATCNARLFGAVAHERCVVDRKQGTGDGTIGSLGDVLDRSFNVYIGSTFRRADFDRVGGFDEAMTHCEDFDFWVRLLLLAGTRAMSMPCSANTACDQARPRPARRR